jgi:CheY-like chemotaxis protein
MTTKKIRSKKAIRPQPAVRGRAKKSAARKKILIVEDDQSLRLALYEKLTRAKFEVLTATNGKVGLKQAFAKKPDLILLDILMPVMDGMTMLKSLRKDKWGKNVYVIMLTNKEPDLSLLDEAKRTPYLSSYIMKDSIDMSDIAKLVKNGIIYSNKINKTL